MGSIYRNAVLSKDLKLRMRRPSSLVLLVLYLAALGVVLAVFLSQHNILSGGSTQLGMQLFSDLAVVELCLIVLVAPVSTASALSGERHARTWDLILVTRLSAFDIIWGKFLAGFAFNALLIVVPLPLYGAVFLFGGVSVPIVLRTFTVLLLTAALLTALSLAISLLSRRPTVSAIGSAVVALCLGLLLSLIVLFLEANPGIAGLANLAQLGSLTPGGPPLTPLAQIDPVVALLSALPAGGGATVLGNFGSIDHAFGLPLRLDLWQAYGLLAALLAAALLVVTTRFARHDPPAWRLRRIGLLRQRR